jgi:hypothetical protein
MRSATSSAEQVSSKPGWPEHDVRTIMGAAIYAGRLFVGIRGSVALILEYDGSRWKTHEPWKGLDYDRIDTLAEHRGRLYCGSSSTPGKGGGSAIYAYDGRHWTVEAEFAESSVWKLLSADELYAAVGSPKEKCPKVFRHDSGGWMEIGAFPGYTHLLDLEYHDGDLFAGFIGGSSIWRMNGTRWTREAIPALGSVTALHTVEGTLYAGLWRRRFVPCPMIWRRTRVGWIPVEFRAFREARLIESITSHEGVLYAGGGYPSPTLWGNGKLLHQWRSDKPRYIYNLLSTPEGLIATFGGADPNGGEVWRLRP